MERGDSTDPLTEPAAWPGKRDFYEVLGLTKDADDDALKKAYRRLAMQYHPDRNPGDADADGHFKEAAEAFEVLRDPQETRPLRPLRARGAGGRAESRLPQRRIDLRHLRRHLRRGRPAARAARRQRPATHPRGRPARGVPGRETRPEDPAQRAMRHLRRFRGEARQPAGDVQALQRPGRRHPGAGLLPRPADVRRVPGSGHRHHRPVQDVSRPGGRPGRARRGADHPARHRRRQHDARPGRGRVRRPRRAGGGFALHHPRPPAPAVRAPGDRASLRGADHVQPGGTRRFAGRCRR